MWKEFSQQPPSKRRVESTEAKRNKKYSSEGNWDKHSIQVTEFTSDPEKLRKQFIAKVIWKYQCTDQMTDPKEEKPSKYLELQRGQQKE